MTKEPPFQAEPITEATQSPLPPESGPESFPPDHLDGLAIAEPGGGVPDPVVGQASDAPAIFTAEQFYANFVGLHKLAATLTRLKSVDIAPSEEASARAASDAIYAIACETPWLRFMVEPSNIWLQRAVAIGAYAVPKAIAVNAELQAKRNTKSGAKPGAAAAQPANDPLAGFPKDAA